LKYPRQKFLVNLLTEFQLNWIGIDTYSKTEIPKTFRTFFMLNLLITFVLPTNVICNCFDHPKDDIPKTNNYLISCFNNS